MNLESEKKEETIKELSDKEKENLLIFIDFMERITSNQKQNDMDVDIEAIIFDREPDHIADDSKKVTE